MHSKISKFNWALFCVILADWSEASEPCRIGWTHFDKRCFRYNSHLKNWTSAQTECIKEGGHLAEITSASKNAFLVDLREKAQEIDADSWIGLFRLPGEHPFRWNSSNYAANFTNWAIGEPSDSLLWELCGEMRKSGEWGVLRCGEIRAFFCERPIIVNGLCSVTPCQNGGTCFAYDVNSIFECSCRHGYLGLDCAVEDRCQSNPCLNYGTCLSMAVTFMCTCIPPYTGELCRETCPSGWMAFQGSCYRLDNGTANWFSALTSCRQIGGDLVEITSKRENRFIRDILNMAYIKSAWIGLHDLCNEARYTWVSSGNVVTSTDWASEQLNSVYVVADCVEMWKSGRWNDANCKNKRSYICELSGKDICPPGWTYFGQSCYHLDSNPASWFLAQTLCRKHGGDLVEISSTVENAFLYNLKNDTNVGNTWIGLIYQGNKEAFVWISSGYVANFTNWASGQPSDSSHAKDCIEMRNTGRWAEMECASKRKYICERSKAREDDQNTPLSNCFPNPCLNGGTCNDKKDNYTCSCRPSFFGRNCDEVKSSYCSSNPCRNGGSCFDGSSYYICYCNSNFTGRNCDETCPEGWTLFARSCYNFIERAVNWTSAQTLCKSDSGNFVEINSALENSFLLRLRDNYDGQDAWIGLRKDKIHDTYSWSSSGDDAKYTNWASGQPSRADSLESCVEIRWFGTWYAMECGSKRHYFCERKVIVAN